MNELNVPPPAAFFSPLWGSGQWKPNSPKIRTHRSHTKRIITEYLSTQATDDSEKICSTCFLSIYEPHAGFVADSVYLCDPSYIPGVRGGEERLLRKRFRNSSQ